jgi:hypothetical protein
MATKTPRRYRRFFIPWAGIFRAIFAAAAIGAVALAVLIAAVWRWPEIFFWTAEQLPRKEQKLTDDQEFFKYGSIGNEAREGIPFKLWKVLPKVCSKFFIVTPLRDPSIKNSMPWSKAGHRSCPVQLLCSEGLRVGG